MTKILIVTTSTSEITAGIKTGVWLEEFALPFLKFKELGYETVVASPKGGRSPIDPESVSDKYREAEQELEHTVKLSDIDVEKEMFEAVFLPGGHGCMFDLPENSDLIKIIEYSKHNRKVISAICHGACGLIGAKKDTHLPYVNGKALTCFSDEEEKLSCLEKYMPFLLESKLKELGAHYFSKAPDTSFVVEDNYLITGQNKHSVQELTEKLTAKIERLTSN